MAVGSEQRVQHFADGALLGLRQRLQLFELLLQLRCWPALAGAAFGRCADEFFDADAEHVGRLYQRLHGNAGHAAFVVGHRLLGDAELFGELGLSDAAGIALVGDALAEGNKEGAFVVRDSYRELNGSLAGHPVERNADPAALEPGVLLGVVQVMFRWFLK